MCRGCGVSRGQVLITQYEHSHRLKYFGLLSSEYCLKQVSGIEEPRESTGEQRAKGCSTPEEHLRELLDPEARNAFASCLTNPENTKVCWVPLA